MMKSVSIRDIVWVSIIEANWSCDLNPGLWLVGNDYVISIVNTGLWLAAID